MRNFWAYLQERFPPQANGVLIVSYFAANYLLARGATWPGESLAISWRFVPGCLALLLMFFHLRVLDEHKDYALDLVVHPQRVLSRGLVTLAQLRRLGWLAIVLEAALCLLLGPAAVVGGLLVLVFSWLIYKDFYLRDYLHAHLLVNAVVHLLIMPVYCLFVFAVATGRYAWQAPAAVLWYAWVSYAVGFAIELARKTRAPSDERPGLITYSSVIGPYPAALGALAALLLAGFISLGVAASLHFAFWYHAAVAAFLLIVALGSLHFRLRTTTQTAARLQIYAGAAIFAFDWLLAAELIRLHGLAWA